MAAHPRRGGRLPARRSTPQLQGRADGRTAANYFHLTTRAANPILKRVTESRVPYLLNHQLPAPAPPDDHPLIQLLGRARAERVLAGGKWRVLLHVAGGEARRAEVSEIDIEIGTA